MTYGAVLCGGASRRMGTDKALVVVDCVPMAERVARALAAGGCDPVVFVGGDSSRLGALGRATVPDRWPGEGPVGGLLSALHATDDNVVVAACDLPDLDAATVQRLCDAGDASVDTVDTVVATIDGRAALLSHWRQGARAAVAAEWKAGTRSMAALHSAEALSVVALAVDSRALRNVNTPADLRIPGASSRH